MRFLRFGFLMISVPLIHSSGSSAKSLATVKSGGNEVRNGGSGLYCKGSGSPYVEVLDFYEGHERHILRDLGPADITPKHKLEISLRRLWQLDPARAEHFAIELHKFYDDALFLENINLVNVDDTNVTAIPVDCELKQISVFYKKIFPEDKTFVLNKTLWDLMDNDNKAGLVMHEIVYKQAAWEYGHTNSMRVRYYVANILSDRMNHMTAAEYQQLLKLVNFPATSG